MTRNIPIAVALSTLLMGPVWASGGGSAPMSHGSGMPASPRATPEQIAAAKYNDGLKLQEKADGLSKEVEGATDAKKREKVESNARKAYEKARGNYETAVKQDPKLYQAHGALGYVRRRLGDYEGSLAAYAKALELNPGYTPAIEYRGEAFLGLGRLEDAKSAYMQLFSADRKRADELSTAMGKWVEARKKDPAGVDPRTVEEFSGWLSERLEIARQVTVLAAPDSRW
jgi:tetratricopeptide (TPR) repeat protein